MQTETVLNDKVAHGLRAQFSAERVQAIIAQAQATFQESAYRSGNKQPTPAEPYELFESGWIDRALEYLGFGHWAIGRPKSVTHAEPMKHIPRGTLKPSRIVQSAVSVEPIAQSIIDLFEGHLPQSVENMRKPKTSCENLLIIGEQGSGKTTLARTLAYALTLRYGTHVFSGIEVGGIGALLEYGTRVQSPVRFLVGEDLTLQKIPSVQLSAFFQVRNLIMQRTRLNQGSVVTSFNSHTLFGIERNLRTAFSMLIVKSTPANPYDRSLLKRYFTPDLLDWFEQHGTVSDCLVWDRFHPHGIASNVPLPPVNVLTELIVKPSVPHIRWWLWLWRIAILGAITSPLWLFGAFH